MSTHFWFGGDDVPYLVKKSTRFDDASLSRAPQEDDPYQYGKTPEIASVTVETADGDIVSAGFSAVTYTGTGVTQSITGVGFSPDLVWVKARSDAFNHAIFDTVRGTIKRLIPNDINSESNSPDGLTAFNPDGFDVGNNGSNGSDGVDYVAWCWDAGDTTVTNNEGFIPSQVRANQLSGFSIVSYTGDGDGGVDAVGHGLGVAPSLMIIKNRDSASENWIVYSSELGPDNFLFLNGQDSSTYSSPPTYLNSTHPNEIAFSLGGSTATNAGGAKYIAYCWAESPTQSFGSYTGNGSTDGPEIECGFEPAFVMVKRASTAGGDWIIVDAGRDNGKELYPDLPNVESTATDRIVITSSGFKIASSSANPNESGSTYIYAAFGDTYSEPPVEQQTLQFTAPTSLDNDLKTELFAPGEIVSQDSAYLATSDTVTSIESTAGYVIDNSLMFNGTDSASGTYLVRTQTTQSDRRKFTRSAWIKPCDITNPSSNSEYITHEWSSTSFWSSISRRISTGNISFQVYDNGTLYLTESTSGLSDTSVWGHVVVSVDTTQASVSDRVKIYINGVSQVVTTSGGDIPLNYETPVSMENSLSFVGAGYSTIGTINATVDGYLAEVQKVDGSALSAQEFGEYDVNGRWVPKAYVPSVSTSAITGVDSYTGPVPDADTRQTVDISAFCTANGITGITGFRMNFNQGFTIGFYELVTNGITYGQNNALVITTETGTAYPNGLYNWTDWRNGTHPYVQYQTDTLVRFNEVTVGGTTTLDIQDYSNRPDDNFWVIDQDGNEWQMYGATTTLALTDDTDLDNLYVGDTVVNGGSFTRTVYSGYSGLHIDSVSVDASPENDLEVLAAMKDLPIVVGSPLWGTTYPPYVMYISGTTTFEFTKPGVYTIYFTSQSNDNTTGATVSYGTGTSGPASFTSSTPQQGGAPIEFTITQENATLDITGDLGISSWSGGTDGEVSSVDSTGNTLTLINVTGTWSNGDIATKNIPYGTNGFNLDFSTSSLGADSSGEGNDFTPNNLGAADVNYGSGSDWLATGTYVGEMTTPGGRIGNITGYGASGTTSTFGFSGNDISLMFDGVIGQSVYLVGEYPNRSTWSFTLDLEGLGYDFASGDVLDVYAAGALSYSYYSAVFTDENQTPLGSPIAMSGSPAQDWRVPTPSSNPRYVKIYGQNGNGGGIDRCYVHGFKINGEFLVNQTKMTVVDSPTNGDQISTGAGGEVSGNYATWNPLTIRRSGTMLDWNGNLSFGDKGASTRYGSVISTFAVSTGKWYWEITYKQVNTSIGVNYNNYSGIVPVEEWSATAKLNIFNACDSALALRGNSAQRGDNSETSNFVPTINDGDVIGFAMDCDNLVLTVYHNGVSPGPFPYAMASGLTWTPYVCDWSNNPGPVSEYAANFGQKQFAYPMPEGYKTLRTSNL